MKLLNALRGINGEFEVGRTSLAAASFAAILAPIAFEAWDLAHGGHFDVTAWCLAYPGGLCTLVTGGVLGIGAKDRNVAAAKITQAQPPLNEKPGAD
jgi:hypothetical protein